MPLLNIKTIEERVKALAGREEYDDELLFELLSAYGRSNSSITRLRNGSINIAEDPSREYAQKMSCTTRISPIPVRPRMLTGQSHSFPPLSGKLAF